jgi:hypothetical protein
MTTETCSAVDGLREAIIRQVSNPQAEHYLPIGKIFALNMTANDFSKTVRIAEQRKQAQEAIELAHEASEPFQAVQAKRQSINDEYAAADLALLQKYEADKVTLREQFETKYRETEGEHSRLSAMVGRLHESRTLLERTASKEIMERQREIEQQINDVELSIQATQHQAGDVTLSDMSRAEADWEVIEHRSTLTRLQFELDEVIAQKLEWENFVVALPKV